MNKLFKCLAVGLGSTRKQRMMASELLVEIAALTNLMEATYYETQLLPYTKKYGYDKYLMLLREVKRRIELGFRERNEPRAILASAINKILN